MPGTVVLEEISVTYGQQTVLRGLSRTFESGKSVAIRGPSGSGKSTLLGVISGHLTPDSGSVTTHGIAAQDIDWLVQSSPLFPRRTVLDNACMSLLLRGHGLDYANQEALAALELVGLAGHAGSWTHSLSGGEKQRVAVARSIASGAKVILADEPTASLDAVSRLSVCEALAAATSTRNAIVIVATHDELVANYCDVQTVLVNGDLSEG